MNRSEDITELAKALVAAQSEMGSVEKGSENPYFKSKYADLAACWNTVAPVFTKHNLSITQMCDESEDGVVIETMLLHTSGQFISGRLRMTPVKNDPQGIGSCITYARRYALMAITGLVADVDDDGNTATYKTPPKQRGSRKPASKTVDPEKEEIVNKARGIFMRCKENGMKEAEIMDKFEVLTGKRNPNNFVQGDILKVEEWMKLEKAV